MIILITVAIWLLTILLCVGESYFERDWPRHTFKYFAIYTVLVISWAVIAS